MFIVQEVTERYIYISLHEDMSLCGWYQWYKLFPSPFMQYIHHVRNIEIIIINCSSNFQ